MDDADYALVSKFKWHIMENDTGQRYAASGHYIGKQPDGRYRTETIRMHRLILGLTDPEVFVDHIDGDGLNNRRENLRVCAGEHNGMNRRKLKITSSRYKGVSRYGGSWRARIMLKKKAYYLGAFRSEQKAAAVYNKWARRLHGEFANVNVIEKPLG